MTNVQYVHIISHTHWDREWYLNSQYTNEWLVPFFQALFRILDKEPRYRFVLDGQTAMIEDWCEQLEQQGEDAAPFKQRLSQYATEGRLLLGPYYLQPDWQLVSDEALVRNLMIGEQTARELGSVMRVGWLLDNFGQISQAPQIHDGFSIKGLFVWRGVEMDPSAIQSEFLWKSPDGTTVTAIYLVGSYRNGMRLAAFPESMPDRIETEAEKLALFATTPNILIMNGYDQEMVPDDIMPVLERGTVGWRGLAVKQSTPAEYIDAIVRYRPQLPVLSGALYSGRYIAVFPGVLSSRMYLKTENDHCQRQLEMYVEPLAVVAWALGARYPAEQLNRCWKLLLKNQPHDSICGVSIDDVHTDMERRFQECRRLTQVFVRDAASNWVAHIDTTRYDNGMPRWIVFNTSARERSGLVALDAGVPAGTVFIDADANVMPSQERGDGQCLAYCRIPGLGYTTVYAAPPMEADSVVRSPFADSPVRCDPSGSTLENAFVRIQIHPDGTLTLTDKVTRAIYSHLAVFEDQADAGDTYNFSPLLQDQVLTTRNRQAEIEFLETGPLRARVRIAHVWLLPEGLTPDRQGRSAQTHAVPMVTWLTLEVHSPVVQFHTRVSNTVKDHRLRVLFPTGIQTDRSHAETQFDVVAHKIEPANYDDSTLPADVKEILLGAREPEPTTVFPQRTFVDLNDGKTGFAILNRGLPEYEILKGSNAIALTLFRSIGWIARSDLNSRIGDAGPLIAVPDAQCLRTMDFHYALLLHTGDWSTGGVAERADEFSRDLLAVQVERLTAPLPDAGGFLSLDAQGLKVTAIKRSEDGQAIIVRICNQTERAITGRITTPFQINRAAYSTLGERDLAEIVLQDNRAAPLEVGAKKIVTVRLEIERWSLSFASSHPSVELPNAETDPSDLSNYEPVPVISEAEVHAEEKRVDELGRLLTEKQRLLKEESSREAQAQDLVGRYRFAQLQLDVETAKRAFWEALLSVTLVRRKFRETRAGTSLDRAEGESVKSKLRVIGLILNQTRVSKRAYEYIVDCYHRRISASPRS